MCSHLLLVVSQPLNLLRIDLALMPNYTLHTHTLEL